MNIRRVYRIYVEGKAGRATAAAQKADLRAGAGLLVVPSRANETWTMDFLHDALASGRKLCRLSIEDAYTREMLAIDVDTSLPALSRGPCTRTAAA